jgi:hypothetical protein
VVTDDQWRKAIKAVRSQACVCGAEKLRGMAFCEGCHNKLKGMNNVCFRYVEAGVCVAVFVAVGRKAV